jgi:hypothetical protein
VADACLALTELTGERSGLVTGSRPPQKLKEKKGKHIGFASGQGTLCGGFVD